jgi:putative ABC transport system substrate-binding protein
VDRRRFLLTSLAVAAPLVARAQAGKVPRIGFLTVNSPSTNAARIEAFRQGLSDLGYFEGGNIAIEWRSAEGSLDQLPALAAELVRLKVDVIVTTGSSATRAAKDATATIPIVMAQDGDPVGNGFVVSLARPGGNITGLSSLFSELSRKRLELLKEIIPRLSQVAVLGTSSNPANAPQLRETELAAAALGVKVQYLDVLDPKDIDKAFRAASTTRVDAVLLLVSTVFNSQRTQISELALRSRLPAIYGQQEFMEAGGLMTYHVSTVDLWRRSATYVDKILKGAKPADLPVEQPTKFELVINLKTAKALGLTIPASLLQRADQVIE